MELILNDHEKKSVRGIDRKILCEEKLGSSKMSVRGRDTLSGLNEVKVACGGKNFVPGKWQGSAN